LEIAYLSDLHIERFHRPNCEAVIGSCAERYLESLFVQCRGDALVIAGDIANGMAEGSGELDCFFALARKNYPKIWCVLGNHDYRGNVPFEDAVSVLRGKYPDIVFLENDCVEIAEGWQLFGATVWTEIKPWQEEMMEYYMPDFRKTFHRDGSMLRARETTAINAASFAALNTALAAHPDDRFIVVSHHAPSYKSAGEGFEEAPSNPAFLNDWDDLLLEHQNILHWVHGHVHTPCEYLLFNTEVHCNPHGYIPRERNPRENPYEIKTFEI
jgi:predicted MPP superfamily phosphohydrolase